MQQHDVITPKIQWYPGHIAKYERQLKELLKLVDVVVEVLDARIPHTSVNPRLENQIRNKPTLIILNKYDLADPEQNRRWEKQLSGENRRVLLFDAKTGQGKGKLIQNVLALGEPAMQKMLSKGRKRRPIRVLIAGMPNVGKSTLINSIVGVKKTKTGHRAGVTRDTQWVRIHPEVELMDSPGVIPPILENDEAGALLATVSSIGEAAFDDEHIAQFLIEAIKRYYPNRLNDFFKIPPEKPVTLSTIAEARYYKLPGDTIDTLRAAQALLTDFRQARIGRLTLEHVHNPSTASAAPATKTEAEAKQEETKQEEEPAS